MHLFVYEKLGLGSCKTTRMSLQMGDKSAKQLVGIAEDVQIRTCQIIIYINIVIIDIGEDTEILILLSRPFLATVRALIDVKRGQLTLGVGDENIEFLLTKLVKIPTFKNSCCKVNLVEKQIEKSPSKQGPDKMEVNAVSVVRVLDLEA